MTLIPGTPWEWGKRGSLATAEGEQSKPGHGDRRSPAEILEASVNKPGANARSRMTLHRPLSGASSRFAAILWPPYVGQPCHGLPDNSADGRGRGTASGRRAIITLGWTWPIDHSADLEPPAAGLPPFGRPDVRRFAGIRRSWKLRAPINGGSPHCTVVNLVRSGRKQPQRSTAKCRGNGSHSSLARQITLILRFSSVRTLTYVHVRCAFSRTRASVRSDGK